MRDGVATLGAGEGSEACGGIAAVSAERAVWFGPESFRVAEGEEPPEDKRVEREFTDEVDWVNVPVCLARDDERELGNECRAGIETRAIEFDEFRVCRSWI